MIVEFIKYLKRRKKKMPNKYEFEINHCKLLILRFEKEARQATCQVKKEGFIEACGVLRTIIKEYERANE